VSPTRKVLVVDDHPIFRKGLIRLLASEPGMQVVAEASDRYQALAALGTERPDVVLLDLTLGDDSGLELIKDILAQAPRARVLVLSMHDPRYYAERARAAGALGYCRKEEAVEHLIDAVRTVAAGQHWTSPTAPDPETVPGRSDTEDRVRTLSDREFQIFTLLGTGLETAEIAQMFHLSAKTVDTHKSNLKAKMGCQSSREIRQLAIEWQTYQGR